MPKTVPARLIPWIIGCLLLSGCLPAAQAAPQVELTPTFTASAAPIITAPAAAPTGLPETPQQARLDRTQYQIEARLADDLRTLHVSESIQFTNPSGIALDVIPLAVEANRFKGAFELLHVSASPSRQIETQTLELNRLELHIQPSLPAGQSLTLALEYSLHLPPIGSANGQVFGYTQKQINLADWYPYLPDYSPDAGWRLHAPARVGEHTLYSAADFDVALHLPPVSPALVVAASAPAETLSDGFAYHVESARNFTWSASQEYRVSSRQAGALTVTSYTYPDSELPGRAALDYTVQALDYFSKQFGAALPNASLSIVQADFPDGMEFDGLYFLSQRFYYGFDGSPRSYLALIAVHETAHQWWYARVGSDQALEPWLDEGLCTYSELLFYEHLDPQLADWWWGFRVEPYDPSGSLARTIFDFSDFLSYRNSIYLRGAQFLQAVRQAVGDEAFFSALQGYASRESGQIAGTRDLLDAFAASTPLDLSGLEDEYFQP